MNSLKIKLSLFFELIILFQLFLLAKFQITIRSLSCKYPTLLTLENNELILVNENGIHFFDSKLENEYDKAILFDSDLTDGENKKTTMAQFTHENGGYILIIAKDILYILKEDGSLIHSLPITDYFTSTNYYIIPYKNEEDHLHYIISYKEGATIKLNYFKFNLNSPFTNENNEKLKTININIENAYQIFGLNCIFMTPPLSSNIDYDILTCFYCSGQNIYTSSFDPKNNFEKFDSFDYSKVVTSVYYVDYIGGIANNLKTKALVYMIGESKPLWMTFDFKNLFSVENIGLILEPLSSEPFFTKIKYFKQSNQFITLSKNFACHIYFMIYDNDLNAIGRKIFTVDSCYQSDSYDIFYNGDQYTIVIDNNKGNVLIQEITDIEILKVDIKTDAFQGDEVITETKTVIEPTFIETDIKTEKNFIETDKQTEKNLVKTDMKTEIKTEKNIIKTDVQTEKNLVETDMKTETYLIETDMHTEIKTEKNLIETDIQTEMKTEKNIIETDIQTEIKTEKNIIETDIQTEMKTEKNLIETDIKTEIKTEKNVIETDIITEKNLIETDIQTEKTLIETDMQTEKNVIETDIKTDIQTEKIVIETDTITNLETNAETNINTLKEYSSYSIPVTNEVTEIQNTEENISFNIKCKKSTVESSEYNLCTECNNEQGYFQVDIDLHGFKECYNNDTKPINLYLDSDKKYKPCFETCLTCEKGGDEYINNCILCDYKHIKRPESNGTTNCVPECPFGYYFTIYGQYKCRDENQCPEEAKLYIKKLKKCTDNCKKEEKYIYQYNGECFEECPSNTSSNSDNICKDSNPDKCSKSQTEIELKEFLTTGGIDFNAKNYAIEFNYTDKHISLYTNEIYSIILYKDANCIKALSINMPNIDFGNCYLKVKNSIASTTDKNLVIAIVKRTGTNGKSTTSYFFYHPETGDKLDSNTICADDNVIMKEDVKSQLNNTNKDINSILYLTGQNIDVFNISDEFYTDICFHYESPNGKDIALKDRVQVFYPNITLCEEGCTSKGVNLTSMESICDCKFNDLINKELFGDNALINSITGEITDFLSNSNLDILQCYKDVFRKKYIIKNVGGFIIIVIIFIEIIFTIIFLAIDKINIIKYIYNLSEFYIIFLSDNIYNSIKINFPPKKHINIKKNNRKKHKKNNFEENYSNNVISTQKDDVFISNKKEKKKNENIDFNEYLKTDYDDLDFDSALKLDQRSFCEYYSDKLIEKQIFVDTFYTKDNIRPRSIKILLFLLNLNLYFVVNGFFFSDEYISELYFSNEEETFFSYFPRSIGRFFYATLVGVVIGFIIDCIFVDEKKVKRIFLREKENTMHLRYEISLIAKQINKRYIAFIVICFFISIISWYYISCFNNVYPGVRNEWIKSSITIFLIMQILSIIFVLLETIIRSLSFKCKSEKIYKLKKYFS